MFETNYNYIPGPYPPPPHPYPPAPPCHPGTPIYIDPSLSISGAAADAKITGDVLASKVDKESLSGLSVNLIDNKIELAQYLNAEDGQVPSKISTGLKWITPATSDDIDTLNESITDINEQISSINGSISTLERTVPELVTNVDTLNTLVATLSTNIDSLNETKLDKSEFQDFLDSQISEITNNISDIQDRLTTLESCCQDVEHILGDVNNYDQPIYQTMQDFETHLQALNRDFDGGDLDLDVQKIAVPDVVGKSAATANTILGRAGLFTDYTKRPDQLTYIDDRIVIATDPEAGKDVNLGSLVRLICQSE